MATCAKTTMVCIEYANRKDFDMEKIATAAKLAAEDSNHPKKHEIRHAKSLRQAVTHKEWITKLKADKGKGFGKGNSKGKDKKK